MNRIAREKSSLWLFITPCLLFMFALRIVPLMYSVVISVLQFDIVTGSQGFVGLKHYAEVFSTEEFFNSMKVTVIFTISATASELLIGLLIAVLLTRNLKGKNAFKVVLLVPMFISEVAVGTVWYIMYHDQVGPLVYLLRALGVGDFSFFNRGDLAMLALVISDVWQWTPFMFILLHSGLESIDPQLYEAAAIDGASRWQAFRRISLPLLSGTIFLTVLLRSMDAFRDFGKVYVLTGGGPGTATELISMLIYRMAFKWLRMDEAAALVVILLVVLASVYYFVVRLMSTEKVSYSE